MSQWLKFGGALEYAAYMPILEEGLICYFLKGMGYWDLMIHLVMGTCHWTFILSLHLRESSGRC